MKVIKEKLDNFPEKVQPVANCVEAQALEDTTEFDKRKAETDKEVAKLTKLPVDGAPKANKPDTAIVPDKLKESLNEAIDDNEELDNLITTYYNLIYENYEDAAQEFVWRLQSNLGSSKFYDLMVELFGEDIDPPHLDESFTSGAQITDSDKTCNEELLDENINEEDAARIVLHVLSNSFGIDAEIESYNDPLSKATIIQFVLSKDLNNKVIYDEFKEKLYKRFNHNVNISCKTFTSPNLEEHRVEYKIKVLVIKEKKNKWGASNSIGKMSLNLRESLEEARADGDYEPLSLFDILWNDLSADNDHEYRRIPAINADLKSPYKEPPIYPNNVRYSAVDSNGPTSNTGVDVELSMAYDGENIKITPKGMIHGTNKPKDFSFAEHVADVYVDYGVELEISDVPDREGNTYAVMIIPNEYAEKDITEHEKAWQKERKAQKLNTQNIED